jgi:group I intron endonuclease
MEYRCDKTKRGVIYMFVFENGKLYIGQTVQSLGYRVNQHLICSKNNNNRPVCNAIRKYDFYVEILKECSGIEDLNKSESYFINKYRSNFCDNGYNCDSGGSNKILTEYTKLKISKSNMGKKMSESSKIKMRNKKLGIKLGPYSEEHRKKISNGNIGKKKSPEHIANMKASHVGLISNNKGKKLNDEARLKMSIDRTGIKRGKYKKNVEFRKNKGVLLSEEHKKKLSIAKIGHKVSAETRLKMSLSHKKNGTERILD